MLQKYTISENTCCACSVQWTKIEQAVRYWVLSNPNKLLYFQLWFFFIIFSFVCVCVCVVFYSFSSSCIPCALASCMRYCSLACRMKNMKSEQRINRMDLYKETVVKFQHIVISIESKFEFFFLGSCSFPVSSILACFLALNAQSFAFDRNRSRMHSNHLGRSNTLNGKTSSSHPFSLQNDKFVSIPTVLFVEHPFGIMLCHSSTKWTAQHSFTRHFRWRSCQCKTRCVIWRMEFYVLITNCIFYLAKFRFSPKRMPMVLGNFK